MFNVVAARFKVGLGIFTSFEEDDLRPVGEAAAPALATRGRAGDDAALGVDFVPCVAVVDAVRRTVGNGSVGDFAVAAAEEPAGVFVDPSAPDFIFFCRYLRQ